MNILLVKLSSLGDVLHNLPIVWDIRKQYPDARVDWVIEEGYTELITPLLTSDSFKGIDNIIPLGLRRLRKEMKQKGLSATWAHFIAQRDRLQTCRYDIVIETQGLLKAALITAFAKKTTQTVVAGIGNRTQDSGYEPLSRVFYTNSVKVPLQYHAVDRSRAVTAVALSQAIPHRQENPPQFYPHDFIDSLKKQTNPLGLSEGSYVMCFHATARMAKAWSIENWIQIGKYLNDQQLKVVLPWGNPREKLISEQIAQSVPNAIVPNAFSIKDAFTINAQAGMVIGVDTGLTHMAAVLGTPTIEIYVDSPRWKTEGYWSDGIYNVGDTKSPPTYQEVQTAVDLILSGN